MKTALVLVVYARLMGLIVSTAVVSTVLRM
jgi:hypothetical protein